MIEPLLRRLVQHERRKTIVIVVTILTGLLVVLPAADEYNAARGRVNAAKGQLLEIRSQANDLPHFQKLFQVKAADLKQLESQAVSESVAERLQNELVEMVRQSGCTMRLIRPGDPLRRDWTTKDHAVRSLNVTDRGENTPVPVGNETDFAVGDGIDAQRVGIPGAHPSPEAVHPQPADLAEKGGRRGQHGDPGYGPRAVQSDQEAGNLSRRLSLPLARWGP